MPGRPVVLPVDRLRQVAVCLLLTVTAFHQSPGLIGNDTKLDLTADPLRFLQRALDLWNPASAFGQLQNQAYGYLFPMGAFHLLGVELGLPGWVVQRAWMALLLVVAFTGVLRLAGRLELGTSTTRLLGGLAYALSPRVLTEIGGNSSEILPLAVLPWVLVPLVGVRAREHPRVAAMRSGVALLCMGAVNATAVIALLPLPVLWLLPGLRDSAGRRLAAWWVLAGGLACTWWFVPLLLQGKYSPPFLDYIETARTTTGTTSLSEVLRGTSHWLAYVSPGGAPWWRSGWTLVTNAGVIINTAVLAALCLVGLLRRGMPAQGRLAAAAGVGLLAMSAAHSGPLGAPFAESLRGLLDGPLAPFRNVHKFDPLVRLPLALGLCHLLARATPGRARTSLAALVSIAMIGVAAPALAGQLVPSGGYAALPSWWQSTGAWLDDHAGRGRALVVPASSFGEYQWGRPLDNPLQALTRSPWAVRDAVPLGSAGTTRLLDAIGARLDTGRGSAATAQVLARSGVRYLVVSNDLDRLRTGAPRPVLVHQALADSPGVRLVQSFGPTMGDTGTARAFVADRGLDPPYAAVEVYEVTDTAAPVEALPRAATWVLSGGPESLFQLADRGLLVGRPTVLAGDGVPPPSARPLLTDALRRREVNFGSVRDNASATLTPTQPLTRAQAVPDVLPVQGVRHLATARTVGVLGVSASSSAADAGAVVDRGRSHQPFAAFDGDPETAWVSGALSGGEGQWLQVDLGRYVDPEGTTVRLFRDERVKGVVTQVRVRTDRGERLTQLYPDESAQALAVPPGLTRHLRVTVTGVLADAFATVVGVRELAVPGVSVQQTIALPDDQQQDGETPVVLVDRAVGQRDACIRVDDRSVCSPDLARAGEDLARLDRTFTVRSGGTFPLAGTARPVPGAALDALLDAGNAVHVSATSRLVTDPVVRPGAMVDADPATGWIAGDKDAAPSISLSWGPTRTVDRIVISTSPDLVAARPTRVDVVTAGGTTSVEVGADGVVRFPAVATNRLQLRVLEKEPRASVEGFGGLRGLPVGISELTVPGLEGLATSRPEQLTVPCGTAPPVTLDGMILTTTATASRSDLQALRLVPLQLCGTQSVDLTAGSHRLTGDNGGSLQVEGLSVGTLPEAPRAMARQTLVSQWGAERRVVVVGPGEDSFLLVHENANSGWRATLHGRVLTSARIDGWQQAWVLPAGQGGRVLLEFRPARAYHLALLIGALLVGLLLALACWPSRVGRSEQLLPEPAPPVRLPVALKLIAALSLLVPLGGLAAGAIFVLLWAGSLRVRRGEPLPVVAGGALVLAGLLTAWAPWNGSRSPAAFGAPVQALALVALAAACAALSGSSPSVACEPAPGAPPDEGSTTPPAG